jgi:hypothetical protein
VLKGQHRCGNGQQKNCRAYLESGWEMRFHEGTATFKSRRKRYMHFGEVVPAACIPLDAFQSMSRNDITKLFFFNLLYGGFRKS